MAELIITNGDQAADLLLAAGSEATILPWRDVLHEGPIVTGPLEACSAVRSAYLAARFNFDASLVAEEFAGRDAVLLGHANFDRVSFWFEHDLYDQLQLVQVLAFFGGEPPRDGLVLVQADDFLGRQTAATILRFADAARPLDAYDLALADAVWTDLAASTPEAIVAGLQHIDGRLPFLAPAIRRFLAELPAPGSGLGRTEAAILAGIAGGIRSASDLFRAVLDAEEAAFMGDLSFFRLLDDLAFASVPLVTGLAPSQANEADSQRYLDAELELTMAGEDVAAGEDDHVALSGIDRWWAGTHLEGSRVWRFDRERMALVPPGI